MLSFYDAEPRIARVWLVETLAAGAWALERRERYVSALTDLVVDRWPPPPGVEPHPLAAPGVMASVLNVMQAHVLAGGQEPLVTLLGPLMGLATAPYMDAHAVRKEIKRADTRAHEILAGTTRPPATAGSAGMLPDVLRDPRARRARRCLLHLAEHPGASNRQVANAIGVTSQTEISPLLARLHRMELLSKRAGRAGHANAWALTADGERVARALAGRRPDVRTNHTEETAGDG